MVGIGVVGDSITSATFTNTSVSPPGGGCGDEITANLNATGYSGMFTINSVVGARSDQQLSAVQANVTSGLDIHIVELGTNDVNQDSVNSGAPTNIVTAQQNLLNALALAAPHVVIILVNVSLALDYYALLAGYTGTALAAQWNTTLNTWVAARPNTYLIDWSTESLLATVTSALTSSVGVNVASVGGNVFVSSVAAFASVGTNDFQVPTNGTGGVATFTYTGTVGGATPHFTGCVKIKGGGVIQAGNASQVTVCGDADHPTQTGQTWLAAQVQSLIANHFAIQPFYQTSQPHRLRGLHTHARVRQRGRVTTPPQSNPPFPFAEIRPSRQLRPPLRRRARHGLAAFQAPGAPPPGAKVRARAFLGRRARVVTAPPTQAPGVPTPGAKVRARAFLGRRGRVVTVPPAQDRAVPNLGARRATRSQRVPVRIARTRVVPIPAAAPPIVFMLGRARRVGAWLRRRPTAAPIPTQVRLRDETWTAGAPSRSTVAGAPVRTMSGGPPARRW
jgi:hypothetical protein